MVFTFVLGGATISRAATAVTLGDADGFAILAGSGITIGGAVNTSAITGDIGSYSTPTIIGLGNAVLNGTNHAGDATTQLAKTALTTAYLNAEGQTSPPVTTVLASNVDSFSGTGYTLAPGIYKSASTMGITGTLTLNGSATDIWIFQAGSSLTTAGASQVVLTGGAQACNVFWQVGSSATLGASSNLKGNVLALTSIGLGTTASVTGRVLAQNGSVTLDGSNTITKSTCATPPPVTPVTPASATNVDNTITVIKQVINDNGGTATFSDFPLFVNGNSVQSGESVRLAQGTYTVTETNRPGYTRTFTGNCDANGIINHGGINTHDDVCTVVNNDNGAPPVAPVPPLISVVKVPNPLDLPNGSGPVTYTYTVKNIGTVPMTDVTLVGDTCSPIVLTSGDTNNDSKLDVNETWIYNCTKTLTQTTKNTVVATGHANGLTAVDVASAIVVVGAPVVPPLIHITKVPSPLALPAGAGLVTYTEKVTNPGTVALSNVMVTDDKCSPVSYVSGDTNNDSKLDVNETWTYACKMNLAQTMTNTAIATGSANGLTVTDFALATVVVAVPKLPNTGLPPEENSVPWNIIIASGVFAALAFFYVARRKQTN